MNSFEKKHTGLLSSLDLKSGRVQLGYWIMFAILVMMSAVCIFPPFWIFVSSFKDIKEFLSVPPTIIPQSFHPEKLPKVWGKLNFQRYYLNSLYSTLGVWFFSITVNGLTGYVLSRLKPRGSRFVFTLILWTLMLPTSISLVPLFKTFIDFTFLHINLTNTYLPMWFIAGANAFNVLLFKSFFDSIPITYLEAARIDGCGSFGIFFKIIVPLSMPILMVVSIFSITGAWEDFFWPYMVLKNPQMYTVAVAIYQINRSVIQIDEYMIVLFLSIIPPAVVFMLFQKQIMSGISVGGIKG